ALAVLVFVLAKTGAPEISRDLSQSPWRWPLFIIAGGSAVGAVVALWNRRFALARICAVGEVAAILWSWALAQYPYLVEPDITIYNSAAPISTLRLLLLALVLGALLLFPSLYYLFRIFKGGSLFEGPKQISHRTTA
ncbi:MAG: cytochrome BD ubiquinol oxidase subunit II, partial [Nitrospiraceae bacterium]